MPEPILTYTVEKAVKLPMRRKSPIRAGEKVDVTIRTTVLEVRDRIDRDGVRTYDHILEADESVSERTRR